MPMLLFGKKLPRKNDALTQSLAVCAEINYHNIGDFFRINYLKTKPMAQIQS
jgi:hypothetical protein